jgi:hypothetical protein
VWSAAYSVDGVDPLRLSVWEDGGQWLWDIDHPDVGDIAEGTCDSQISAMAAAFAAAPAAAEEVPRPVSA